jgi:hypothetical protein
MRVVMKEGGERLCLVSKPLRLAVGVPMDIFFMAHVILFPVLWYTLKIPA